LAKADIFDIWSYIASDSEEAAERVERAIYTGCAFVAESPMRGHSRPGSQPVHFISGHGLAIPTTPSSTGRTRFLFKLSQFFMEEGI
jgi:plasmid stabilization system protein ParE